VVAISGRFRTYDYLPKDRERPALQGTLSEADYFRAEYASAWDQLNHKKAPWKSNPWCWVIDFRRIDAR
jgi:hypothetical protein